MRGSRQTRTEQMKRKLRPRAAMANADLHLGRAAQCEARANSFLYCYPRRSAWRSRGREKEAAPMLRLRQRRRRQGRARQRPLEAPMSAALAAAAWRPGAQSLGAPPWQLARTGRESRWEAEERQRRSAGWHCHCLRSLLSGEAGGSRLEGNRMPWLWVGNRGPRGSSGISRRVQAVNINAMCAVSMLQFETKRDSNDSK